MTGEPNLNVYENKEGVTKTSLELRVSEVKLMGGPSDSDSANSCGDNDKALTGDDLNDEIPW